MITWILAVFLFLWILAERLIKKKKVIGVPLGLPAGTVRACIALLIVTFPLNQLIMNELIGTPIGIQEWFVNTLFVVVAFYFEARAFEKSIPQLLKEVKDPAKYKKTRSELPLYWPRFTVRTILFLFLVLTAVLTGLGVFSVELDFTSTNTITELIFIVVFFAIGLIIRRLHQKSLKNKIRRRLKTHDGSQEELIEILEEKERKNGRISEGLLAFIMLGVLITVLMFFTIGFDYGSLPIPLLGVTVSLRVGMVLLLNLYFGYRQ